MSVCVCAQSCLSPWTVACQAFLSMEFSRQEYWSGLPHVSSASRDLEHFHSLSLSFMTLTFVKNAVLPTFFFFFHFQIKHSSLWVVCCLVSVSCGFAVLSCSEPRRPALLRVLVCRQPMSTFTAEVTFDHPCKM